MPIDNAKAKNSITCFLTSSYALHYLIPQSSSFVLGVTWGTKVTQKYCIVCEMVRWDEFNDVKWHTWIDLICMLTWLCQSHWKSSSFWGRLFETPKSKNYFLHRALYEQDLHDKYPCNYLARYRYTWFTEKKFSIQSILHECNRSNLIKKSYNGNFCAAEVLL